jgi:hypothetical protein
MSELIGLQSIKDFSGGMVTEASPSLTPPNISRLILNLDTDILGMVRVRKGLTAIGDQIEDGKTCLGLHQFRNSGGNLNRQMAVFNNTSDTGAVISYNNSGTWADTPGGTGFTAGSKFRFATFVDLVFAVNDSYTAPLSWDGDTGNNWGNTNLGSAPAGKFIATFKSRLYIGATYANPDRLFFSSVQNDGSITWNTTEDWIDINPSDGQNMTALAQVGGLLLIFKQQAMYRWNGASTDADWIVDVGTTSQESVVVRNGRCYFFSPLGVYVTDGGFPVRISKPIQRWIEAISPDYYNDVAAGVDVDNVYFSIGDVTVDGVAYSNVVLAFEISSQTWRVRAYAEQISIFANYIDSSGNYLLMVGNDDGDVQDFNKGNDDAGTPIFYRLISNRLHFGSYAYIKTFSDFFLFGNNLPGAITFIRSENNESVPVKWNLTGWIKRILGQKYRGRYFVFELAGKSTGGQGEFEGWEITDLAFDGYQE